MEKPNAPMMRGLISHRESRMDFTSNIGKVQIISADSIGAAAGGIYCKVCDVLVKDSIAYIDHINGRKHQKKLGLQMNVKRSTVAEIQQRLAFHKHRVEQQQQEQGLSAEQFGFDAAEPLPAKVLRVQLDILDSLSPPPPHDGDAANGDGGGDGGGDGDGDGDGDASEGLRSNPPPSSHHDDHSTVILPRVDWLWDNATRIDQRRLAATQRQRNEDKQRLLMITSQRAMHDDVGAIGDHHPNPPSGPSGTVMVDDYEESSSEDDALVLARIKALKG